VTLLSRGSPLFSGTVVDSVEYFGSQGYPFPSHENPADFLLDISAVDNRTPEAEKSTMAQVSSLIAAWGDHYRTKTSDTIAHGATDGGGEAPQAAIHATQVQGLDITQGVLFWRQVSVLTCRTLVTTYRDPMGIFGSLFEAITIGIISGWIFYNLDGSLAGIRSKQAALFIAASLQGYLVMLYETYRLTSLDIKVFDRERGEGVIGVVGWLVSRRIARLATEDIAIPFIFSVRICLTVSRQSYIDITAHIKLLDHYILHDWIRPKRVSIH